MGIDLTALDAAGRAELVARGDLTAAEPVDAAIERLGAQLEQAQPWAHRRLPTSA